MPATEMVCLRIPPEQKSVIDWAASVCGRSRTAFIVESAMKSAQHILTEKTHFLLSPQKWAEFQAMLDAPVCENAALQKTMTTPLPWNSQHD